MFKTKKLVFFLTILFHITALSANQLLEENTKDKFQVPRGKYITGGILASTLGLGIGHAVQGRYADKGWIFTSTEVVGLALIANANCFRSRNSNSQDRAERERSDCENTSQALLGVGVFLGFHVWEIVDSWTSARPYEETPEVGILPTTNGAAIAFSIKF